MRSFVNARQTADTASDIHGRAHTTSAAHAIDTSPSPVSVTSGQ